MRCRFADGGGYCSVEGVGGWVWQAAYMPPQRSSAQLLIVKSSFTITQRTTASRCSPMYLSTRSHYHPSIISIPHSHSPHSLPSHAINPRKTHPIPSHLPRAIAPTPPIPIPIQPTPARPPALKPRTQRGHKKKKTHNCQKMISKNKIKTKIKCKYKKGSSAGAHI